MKIRVRVKDTEIEVEDNIMGNGPLAIKMIPAYLERLETRIKDMLDIAMEKQDANTTK